jgi:glycerol kinase
LAETTPKYPYMVRYKSHQPILRQTHLSFPLAFLQDSGKIYLSRHRGAPLTPVSGVLIPIDNILYPLVLGASCFFPYPLTFFRGYSFHICVYNHNIYFPFPEEPMARFVASIDQGTTSTRCMVFDPSGNVVALDQREHRQIYPRPGWVEHDALEIWQHTREVVTNALRKSDLLPTDLAAVGITNQRETTLIWDRQTGQPYGNAIVWQDTRTDIICTELGKEGGQDRLRPQTGLPLATYFSGPKIRWVLDHLPGVREAAERGEALFGNIDTWLIWNLTGGVRGGIHVTDVTNASRTLLMNLATLNWDEEILKILDIPKKMLPNIQPSSFVYGYAKDELEGVPVAGDLGDQQAALFGQACYSPGEAKNTFGTGCFMLMNTGTKPVTSDSGLLTTLGYQIGNQPAVYCLEGSIAITGALVQWLRDNLKMIDASSDIEPLARTVENNGGMYIVPAFSGLFAPYWRSDARGVIVGLTRYINRGHFARAVLESTAYQVREVLDAMEKDSGVKLTSLKVDGGMVVNDLLMQFQADLLGVPVVRPRISETTSLGAAYAAGLAVGYWKDFDQLRANWGKSKEWTPQMPEENRQRLYSSWKKAVTRTFDWID